MKILILGGTRYFGLNLLRSLLKEGHDITVATRGNKDFAEKSQVRFVKADRDHLEDLKSLATLGPFDLIFDQVCMSGMQAEKAVQAFKNSCGKYIFASTGSIYPPSNGGILSEEIFDNKTYPLNLKDTDPYDYQEAKRQAEAVLGQQAFFPAVMVRFPIVLGLDDYSGRLNFHIDRIKEGKDIFFPNLESSINFVTSHEAGEFLKFIAFNNFEGAVNCASKGQIKLKTMVELIEKLTGKKAVLASEEKDSNHSPFGFDQSFVLDNQKATQLGFSFSDVNDYLLELINAFK